MVVGNARILAPPPPWNILAHYGPESFLHPLPVSLERDYVQQGTHSYDGVPAGGVCTLGGSAQRAGLQRVRLVPTCTTFCKHTG